MKIWIILLFICICEVSTAQYFEAGVKVYDGDDDERVSSVVVQANGTVIAAINGYNSDYIAIDTPGLPPYAAASQQMIVAFSNDLTDTLWTVASTGNDFFNINELELDSQGNIYAYFSGGMSADLAFNGVTVAPEFDGHALIKFDPNGNFVWCRYLDGQIYGTADHFKIVNDVAHVMLSFDQYQTVVNPITMNVLTTSHTDAYIIQIDPDNVVLDFFHLKSPSTDFLFNEFAVSSNGRYAVHAHIYDDVFVNGNLMFAFNQNAYHLFEFDFADNFIDSCAFNCVSSTMSYGINDQLHVAGEYGPFPTLPVLADSVVTPGIGSKLLARLNLDLEIDWMKIYSPDAQPSSGYPEVVDILIDCNGYIYLTGTANDNTNFGGLIFNEVSTLANDEGDLFVFCADSIGNSEWLLYGGGPSFNDIGFDLAHDLSGGLFLAASYSTASWFGGIYMSYTSGSHDNGVLLKIGDGVQITGVASCLNIPPILNIQSNEICFGDSLFFEGNYYDSTGIYGDTLITLTGQDSISLLELTVNNPYLITQSLTICNGDSVLVGSSYYSVAGNYTDSLVSSNGCDSVINTSIIIDNLNTLVTENLFLLSVNLSGMNYQWVYCPSYIEIPGANSQDFMPLSDGDFAVIVDDGVCVDTSNCVNVFGLGMTNETTQNQTQIYPNPANQNVKINAPFNGEIIVESVSGEIVLEDFMYSTTIHEINTSDWANGLYFIHVYNKNGVSVFKLVIQH